MRGEAPSSDQPVVLDQIDLGIVCPMADEAATAVAFVDEVLSHCEAAGFRSVVLLAVLDRVSTDATRGLLEAHRSSQPGLRVVWAPEDRSVVDAYVRGYREALTAGCDWILEIDAGFSHQPSELGRFFEAMSAGRDCVFGSRFCPGGSIVDSSWRRRVISRGGTVLANKVLGTTLTDMTSGYELFSRDTLTFVLAKGIASRGPFFQTEIKAYCRHRSVAEVPITYRAAGHHVGRRALKDSFVNLWRLYRLRRQGRL